MTPERLRALVRAGEKLSVEFKGEEARPLSDDALVEAVVCLANRDEEEVGWLLVGVEDDGRITGARPRHSGAIDPLRIVALIANRTRPPLSVRAEVVEVDSRRVLVLEVPRAPMAVATSDGKFVRRVIQGSGRPGCLPMTAVEVAARGASFRYSDASARPVGGTTWEDLSPVELARLRETVRRYRGDAVLLELTDFEMAKALGMVEANGEARQLTVCGLLLAGREDAIRRHLPTHEVAFQVLRGLDVEVNEFFRLPLVQLLDEVMVRFKSRNREAEVMTGLFRVGIPEYPERAFREAVINALVHRDYTRMGAVHVQWYPDRIEVSNPGGFPEGVRLDNLLVTPPRPRNPLLAEAFKRLGLVERTARGIDTIYLEQLRNGRPLPSYERSTESDVVLVLRGGESNLRFVQLVVEEDRADRPLGLDELIILNQLFLERVVTVAEAARRTQKPPDETRGVLERLVERGLLERRGATRPVQYQLSGVVYRRLGMSAEYARARGPSAQEQVQRVLQHVREHGAISRAEVAQMCQLAPRQAGELLQRLVAQGRLVPLGTGRGRRYVAAEKSSGRS